MKLCTLSLALASLSASASANARPLRPSGPRVIATLIDQGPRAPACGRVQAIVPMRFHVERVAVGSVSPGEITVMVPCPELGPTRFVVGARYALSLTTQRREGAIFWASGPRPREFFWLLAATNEPSRSAP